MNTVMTVEQHLVHKISSPDLHRELTVHLLSGIAEGVLRHYYLQLLMPVLRLTQPLLPITRYVRQELLKVQ